MSYDTHGEWGSKQRWIHEKHCKQVGTGHALMKVKSDTVSGVISNKNRCIKTTHVSREALDRRRNRLVIYWSDKSHCQTRQQISYEFNII
jgi:hypothetical protein